MSHSNTEFVLFENAIYDSCEWGIDISTLSEKYKNIVHECHQFIDDRKYMDAEKYAISLLKTNYNNPNYHLLCAHCYMNKREQIESFGISFPHNPQYYQHLADQHFYNALQIEPNNPIYLIQYATFFYLIDEIERTAVYFEKIKQLFENETYQYNNKYITIKSIEHDFQSQYIAMLILERYYHEYDVVFTKLNQLYLRFEKSILQHEQTKCNLPNGNIEITIRCSTNFPLNLVELYVIAYSRIGEYMKAYDILEQYLKYNSRINYYPTFGQYICIYLEIGKYNKIEGYVNNICCKYRQYQDGNKSMSIYDHFNQEILYHGYLCLINCYKYYRKKQIDDDTTKMIHKTYGKYQKLIGKHKHFFCDNKSRKKMDRVDYDNISSSIIFLKIAFIYLCIKTKCNNIAYTQICKELIKTIKIDDVGLHKKCDKYIHDTFPQFIYNVYLLGMIAKSINVHYLRKDTNFYFFLCLSLFNKCINKDPDNIRGIMHPCIPLSYYHIASNALNKNQYQIAFKFLKKSMKITKDLKWIQKNCHCLLKQCEMNWKQQKCGYCQDKYMHLNGNKLLKCCKGCCSTFYCSKKCQKKDWKLSHRHHCNKKWLNKHHFVNDNYCWFS